MRLNLSISVMLAFIGIVFLPRSSSSQERDANLWTRFAVKYDLNKNTRLSLEEEFRFFNNASMLDQNHTEIGIKSELLNRLSLGAYYRFIYEKDIERAYSLKHRGWVQIEFLLLDRDMEISIRNRFQGTVEDVFSSENGHLPEWYNRYKFSLDYKPKNSDWIPGAGIEFWHALNRNGNSVIDKLRSSLELEYRYKSHWRWRIFYAYQRDLQIANPVTDHIFGIASTYMIN